MNRTDPHSSEEAAAPRSHRASLGIGLVVVALIGLTAWGLFAGRLPLPDSQFRSLQAGDCLRLRPTQDAEPNRDGSLSVGHEEVNCDDPNGMSYTVAVLEQGEKPCPTTDYVEYYQIAHVSPANPTEERQWTTCLMPNYRDGLCYAEDEGTLGYQPVPCTQAATFQIAGVSDRADEPCAEPARPLVFPQPPRTVCVRSPA